MAEYTLEQIFGTGATQNISTITIQKSAFPSLTPTAANTAESLLVSLMILWLTNLTEANRVTDEANRQISFTDAGVDVVAGQTADYFRRSYALSLYKLFVVATLDPDEY